MRHPQSATLRLAATLCVLMPFIVSADNDIQTDAALASSNMPPQELVGRATLPIAARVRPVSPPRLTAESVKVLPPTRMVAPRLQTVPFPKRTLTVTRPLTAQAGTTRELRAASAPRDKALAFPLDDGVTVSFSRQCATGENIAFRISEKYAGLPEDPDVPLKVGQKVTVKGSVRLERATQTVYLNQKRIDPSHGLADGRRFCFPDSARNGDAIKRILAEAQPGTAVWMSWECTVDALLDYSTAVRDVERFAVIDFKADGVAQAAVEWWSRAAPEIGKLIVDQPRVWNLLSCSNSVALQPAVQQIAALPQDDVDVVYDPIRQIAEVRWPQVPLWTEEARGKTYVYGVARSFILTVDPAEVYAIAVFLTRDTVRQDETRLPVLTPRNR